MSIDFHPEMLHTGRFRFACGERLFGPFGSQEAAGAAASLHVGGCEDCEAYGVLVEPVMDVDACVNLSNANAGMLLGILGYDTEYLCGSTDAEDFLGRCLVALAEERDGAAVSSATVSMPGGGTWVDCGLPAGYFGTRLGELADVASVALMLGRRVCWG